MRPGLSRAVHRAAPARSASAALALALLLGACAGPAPPAATSDPSGAAAMSATDIATLQALAADGPYAVDLLDMPAMADRTRQRRVPMLLYLPKGAAGARPLVLMSHGAGGSRRANHAQSRHLASHGFAVLALEHVGSDTARLLRGGTWMANLREMTSDRDELLARPRDVRFALDMAQQWTGGDTALRGRLDLTRAALVGHSYGAYTALVGCGARAAQDWMVPPSGHGLAADESEPRLKACVAYSPQGPGEPFFLDSSYASIRRPVLHVSGSRDQQQGGRPPLQRQQAFDRSPPGGHVLLWLAHADHSAFSDPTGSGQNGLPSPARADAQPVTRAATLAFLQRELLGRTDADAHLTQDSLQALRRGIVDDIEVRRR